MMGISEIEKSVAEKAGDCPGCGTEAKQAHVVNNQDYTGDDHFGLSCSGCSKWQYDHDREEWFKLTPPGKENPTVQR